MLSYLDNSEASKVGTKEMEEHALALNEPSVDREHIVRHARGEKHKKCSSSSGDKGAKEILVASVARWEEHLRMLTVLERECLDLSEAIEHLSEKQELLAIMMESKRCLQKDAPDRFQEQIFQKLKELEEQNIGAVGTQAQVGKIGEGKGSSQDFTGVAAVRGRRWFCCDHRLFILLFLLAFCGV